MDAYYERGHEYNKRYIDLANPIDPPFVDVISRMYPTLAQLEGFKLPWEMAEQNQLFLNIDFVHSGIGSNDIWSLNAEPLKQYQIKSGSYRFNLRISPDTNSL